MSNLSRILVAAGGGSGGPPLWSRASTWGGQPPQSGDTFLIGAGKTVIYDLPTPPAFGSVQVYGNVIVSDQVDTWWSSNNVRIKSGGSWTSGAPGAPNMRSQRRTMIGKRIEINSKGNQAVTGYTHIPSNDPNSNVSTGNDGFDNDDQGESRGFIVEDGGRYQIYSAVPPVTKAKLQGHHRGANITTLVLDRAVEVFIGDEIIVYTTDFFDWTKRTERFTVVRDTSASNVVYIDRPLGYDRYGELQYPADDKTVKEGGAPPAFTTAPGGMRATLDVKSTIDMRARVMILSRKHVVEGLDDDEQKVKRHGSHDMFHGLGLQVHLEGVQYRQCGQGGRQGRYPIHFHFNAYNLDGTPKTNAFTGLSDGTFAPGQAVVKDCVVMDSNNRIMSLHGCRGVHVENTIGHRIKGHAYFFEDGSEQDNILIDNDVSTIDDPGEGWRLKVHDAQTTGWWITARNNSFLTKTGDRNGACDSSAGPGVWFAPSLKRDGFPGSCFGLSSNVPIFTFWTGNRPDYTGFNSHSNQGQGKLFAPHPVNESGTTTQYARAGSRVPPTPDGVLMQDIFPNEFLWKNSGGAYANNVNNPRYSKSIIADNRGGQDFFGSTDQGDMHGNLFVEESNNNWSGSVGTRQATLTYHWSLVSYDSTVFWKKATQTPGAEFADSGRFKNLILANYFMDYRDTYIQQLASLKAMKNMRFSQNLNMLMAPNSYLQMNAEPWKTWTGGRQILRAGYVYGAVHDTYGTLFGVGAGRWSIVDHPMYTFGAGPLTDIFDADGRYIAMKSANVPFFGLTSIRQTDMYDSNGAGLGDNDFDLQYVRVDPADLSDVPNSHIQNIKVEQGQEYDTTFKTSVPEGAWVRVRYPSRDLKFSNFSATVEFVQPGSFYYGVDWPNDSPVVLRRSNVVSGQDVGNKAALQAATATTWWRDTANSRVWVKFFASGGNLSDTHDENGLQIHGYDFGSHRLWISTS